MKLWLYILFIANETLWFYILLIFYETLYL